MDGPFPILATQDLDASAAFYVDSLGCTLQHQDAMVAYLTRDGSPILLSKSDAESPPHTVAGFIVPNIHAAVADLRGRGVTFDDFGMPSDDQVVTLGDAQLTWFRDPSGNILSLTQWDR